MSVSGKDGMTRVYVDRITSEVQFIDEEPEDISAIVISIRKGAFS
tara:strand:- start:610 stop:744 length:135 start_codon:yes stop_codon:yes gene_type:complete